MGCFVVTRFLLTSASCGPSAASELFVTLRRGHCFESIPWLAVCTHICTYALWLWLRVIHDYLYLDLNLDLCPSLAMQTAFVVCMRGTHLQHCSGDCCKFYIAAFVRQVEMEFNLEVMEEELTCPVCLELYADPLMLPCSHSICKKCLEEMLNCQTQRTGMQSLVC